MFTPNGVSLGCTNPESVPCGIQHLLNIMLEEKKNILLLEVTQKFQPFFSQAGNGDNGVPQDDECQKTTHAE